MKKNSILSKGLVSAWVLAAVLAFSSCSAGSDSIVDNKVVETATKQDTPAELPFTFSIKAFSGDKEVTTKGDVNCGTLFVFDENNKFIQEIQLDKTTFLQRKTISIQASNTDRITVVAWAGLANNKEEVSSLNQNSILSDLRVQLKQNNEQVATSPSDLFYGQFSISRPNQTRADENNTLNITRKVSSINLTTSNVAKKFGTTDGDFYYRIKGTKSAFDSNGNLTGEQVEFIVPATVNSNGHLTTIKTTVFPANDITVELYRNDIMVLSSKNFEKTENLALNAAEQADINFDFFKTNFYVAVNPYGTVVQYVAVG